MRPILFEIGPVVVYAYGTLYLLGLFLGLWLARRYMIRQGLSPNRVDIALGATIFTAFIGMRVLHIWLYPNPKEALTWQEFLLRGGMYYGGFLAGLLVLVGVSFLLFRRVAPILDAVVIGIAAGHALGRIGCFLAGCCYGRPTDLPWGVIFTNRIAHISAGTPLGIRLHPVQIYESALEGLLALFLIYLARTAWLGTGALFATYLLGYGTIRFGLEFLRGVPKRIVWDGLDVNHVISLGFIFGGALIWIWKIRSVRKT